jgi:hypothetical protein
LRISFSVTPGVLEFISDSHKADFFRKQAKQLNWQMYFSDSASADCFQREWSYKN